ncbi:hypothetical protein Tco_0064974 [Tanacetum coccineum]
MADQDTPPPTITAIKIPIIKKGEYDIWSMRMRQYICHTDHNLWDIIVNGDLEDEATPSGEQSSPHYLLKFHNVPHAKSLCAAIKSRFGALVMKNKPYIDEIDINDLYNNLRVYEDEMKKSSTSTSSTQNLVFLSSENTNSTNEVSTASGDFGISKQILVHSRLALMNQGYLGPKKKGKDLRKLLISDLSGDYLTMNLKLTLERPLKPVHNLCAIL